MNKSDKVRKVMYCAVAKQVDTALDVDVVEVGIEEVQE